jgi:hypothetical protein
MMGLGLDIAIRIPLSLSVEPERAEGSCPHLLALSDILSGVISSTVKTTRGGTS